jgi:hypothetical protein
VYEGKDDLILWNKNWIATQITYWIDYGYFNNFFPGAIPEIFKYALDNNWYGYAKDRINIHS